MGEIAIGKYTLESLTTGMYLNSMAIYREYIQNAIDSIDEAVEFGLMSRKDGRILVEIDKKNNKIKIEDNGLGISKDVVSRSLLDIGNSKKFLQRRNGFRGIGRLVGLSYSDKLVFKTSSAGERFFTEIIFDCKLLNELLTPGKYEDFDIKAVLGAITKIKKRFEQAEQHYFIVSMDGVKDLDGILDIERVSDYVSQVAPVPFNPKKFSYAETIHNVFSNHNFELEEHNIYIRNSNEKEVKIYKSNSDQFLADKQKKIWDNILDIKIKEIRSQEGRLIAIVWYGNTELLGTILEENIKGLRLRKGNILIGDKTTLNHVFKEDRFNGWFQGEVFVLDDKIIPNARRDDFERNENYEELLNFLTEIGSDLSKIIRNKSIQRNKERLDKINFPDPIADSDFIIIEEPIEHFQKSITTPKNSEIIRQLQALQCKNKMQYNTKFAILNASTKLSLSEKKILEKVFDALNEIYNIDKAKEIIDVIVKKLNIV